MSHVRAVQKSVLLPAGQPLKCKVVRITTCRAPLDHFTFFVPALEVLEHGS